MERSVRWCTTLSKLIGMLFFCPPTSQKYSTKNELARPVMGTMFLVILSFKQQNFSMHCGNQ